MKYLWGYFYLGSMFQQLIALLLLSFLADAQSTAITGIGGANVILNDIVVMSPGTIVTVGKRVVSTSPRQERTYYAAFSPSGTMIASASSNNFGGVIDGAVGVSPDRDANEFYIVGSLYDRELWAFVQRLRISSGSISSVCSRRASYSTTRFYAVYFDQANRYIIVVGRTNSSPRGFIGVFNENCEYRNYPDHNDITRYNSVDKYMTNRYLICGKIDGDSFALSLINEQGDRVSLAPASQRGGTTAREALTVRYNFVSDLIFVGGSDTNIAWLAAFTYSSGSGFQKVWMINLRTGTGAAVTSLDIDGIFGGVYASGTDGTNGFIVKVSSSGIAIQSILPSSSTRVGSIAYDDSRDSFFGTNNRLYSGVAGAFINEAKFPELVTTTTPKTSTTTSTTTRGTTSLGTTSINTFSTMSSSSTNPTTRSSTLAISSSTTTTTATTSSSTAISSSNSSATTSTMPSEISLPRTTTSSSLMTSSTSGSFTGTSNTVSFLSSNTIPLPTSTLPVTTEITIVSMTTTPDLPVTTEGYYHNDDNEQIITFDFGDYGTEVDETVTTQVESSTTTLRSLNVTNTIREVEPVKPKASSARETGIPFLIISIPAAAILLLLILLIFRCFSRRKKRSRDTLHLGNESRSSLPLVDVQQPAATVVGIQEPTNMQTFGATFNSSVIVPATNSSYVMRTTTVDPNVRELALPLFKEIDMETDLKLATKISSGGGGNIYLAKPKTKSLKNEVVAGMLIVKVLTTHENAKIDEELDLSFKQEVSLHWYFRDNENIAKLIAFSRKPRSIVLKYYPLGSLTKYLHHLKQSITKRVIVDLYGDLLRALLAVHDAGFAHCDVKSDNILMEQRYGKLHAVLTDFGIAQVPVTTHLIVKAFKRAAVDGGSVEYAAPEVLKLVRSNEPVDPMLQLQVFKRDIYSSAIVLAELLSRRQARFY